MSYVEYGLGIFFTSGLDPKFLAGRTNGDRNDKYPECRLQMQDTSLDMRAWSLNQLEYCRYFRELTERAQSTEKIILQVGTLGAVEITTEKELEFLRQELARYKSLRLTPEQKKQFRQSKLREVLLKQTFPGLSTKIGELDEDSVEVGEFNNDSRSISSERELTTENNEEISREMSKSSSSNIKLDRDKTNASYFTSERDDKSSDCCIKSKSTNINEYEDDTTDETNAHRHSQNVSSSNDSVHERTSEMKSRMNALKYSLNMKEAEMKESKNMNSELKLLLEDRDKEIENLHGNLAEIETKLKELTDQHDFEVNALKIKLSDGRNLINQLKKKLRKQQMQANISKKEIQNYEYETINMKTLEQECHRLANKLKEVLKNVSDIKVQGSIDSLVCEWKNLMKGNENLKARCCEPEDGIIRSSEIMDYIKNENTNECLKLNIVIENLRAKFDGENQRIEKYLKQFNILQPEDSSDNDLDQKLGTLLKTNVELIKQFSVNLQDAWNCVEQGKIEIGKLWEKIIKNDESFQDKIKVKTEEVEFHSNKCDELQEIIKNQREEIKELKDEKNVCNNYDEEFVHDLEKKFKEMELKHLALREKNSDLTEVNMNLNCKINKLNNERISLENENEKFSYEIRQMNVKLGEKDMKISALKDVNSQIEQILKMIQAEHSNMLEKSELFEAEEKEMNIVFQLQKQIMKDNKDKRKLKETITNLRDEFDLCRSRNEKLEANLVNTICQKTSLENKISTIKEDILNISNDYGDSNFYTDVNLMHLPKKLIDSINNLKERLDISDSLYKFTNEVGEYFKPAKIFYADQNKFSKILENKQNNTILPSTFCQCINSSFEQNINDYSKMHKPYENNDTNNSHNVISFPHNGVHNQMQITQRHINFVKLENLQCKQFIRNCSERFNNEKYLLN